MCCYCRYLQFSPLYIPFFNKTSSPSLHSSTSLLDYCLRMMVKKKQQPVWVISFVLLKGCRLQRSRRAAKTREFLHLDVRPAIRSVGGQPACPGRARSQGRGCVSLPRSDQSLRLRVSARPHATTRLCEAGRFAARRGGKKSMTVYK